MTVVLPASLATLSTLPAPPAVTLVRCPTVTLAMVIRNAQTAPPGSSSTVQNNAPAAELLTATSAQPPDHAPVV